MSDRDEPHDATPAPDPTQRTHPTDRAQPTDATDRTDNTDPTKDLAMNTANSEHRLRKALSTVNELQPPRDDLFVQRAVMRGRARTARRRSALLSGAAALLVVGAVGGSWAIGTVRSGGDASSAGAAASAPGAQRGDGNLTVTEGAGPTPGSADAPTGSGAPTASGAPDGTGAPQTAAPPRTGTDNGVSGARDQNAWLQGPLTPQRSAFDSIAATLAARYPDVFSGAYAADAGNTRIVVALTRRDGALERLVTGAMPSPGDVEFVLAQHSFAEKQRVAAAIVGAMEALRSQGVLVREVRLDGRTDRVVVTADEGTSPGLLARTYGADLVSVIPTATLPTVTLPNGSTPPPLQR